MDRCVSWISFIVSYYKTNLFGMFSENFRGGCDGYDSN